MKSEKQVEQQREKNSELLIRIDERTKTLVTDLNDLKKDISEEYVKRAEYNVLKAESGLNRKILFLLVGLILTAVIGAIMSLILRQNS